MTQSKPYGSVLATFAFVLWGLVPLFYQYIHNANIEDLLALRVIFSVPLMFIFMRILKKPLPSWKALIADKRSVLICGIAGALMCVSWYAFTWALTHDHVLDASLGYFINPLFSIALGMIVMKERLRPMQKIAVLLAMTGIAIQIIHYGTLPALSLLMASFFALYGLCKKFIRFDALTSVTLEALLLMPFAVAFLIWQGWHGEGAALHSGWGVFWLYTGAAPATVIPLIFFALALQRTELSLVGLLQYIEPSIQFLLAVFFFHESFNPSKSISFSFIWIGLILCIGELMFIRKKTKKATMAHP